MVTSVVSSSATRTCTPCGSFDVAQMLRIVDLEARRRRPRSTSGIAVRRAAHFDRVGHDVDRAAALHAGRLLGADDVDRNRDADERAFAEPHEIDMDRDVPDRIELEVARDHAVLRAVDLEVVKRGQEVARVDSLAQLLVIERDGERGFVVAVDHVRARGPRDALPGRPPCRPSDAPSPSIP